jgi:two-component system sensor histidine kinase KdpD
MRGVRRSSPVLRYLLTAAAVAIVALAYRYVIKANPTTVALTYLLVVLTISTTWGLAYAVFTAVLATLAVNFFFLPPVGTLTISDPQNWVALFTFLVTAVVASQLSERARREARNATARRLEVERLYNFSQRLLSTENQAELFNAIPRYIVDSFDVKQAAVWLPTRPDVYRSSSEIAGLDREDLQAVCARGEPKFDPQRELSFVPMRMGVRVVGSVGLSGAPLARPTLEAIGSLIATATERANAMERLSRAEASRESEQLRSVLLDSVTHEFRTPLTAIKASVTSMLSNPALAPDQTRELLTVINEESDRLDHLVGEAAEMAQLDAQQVELHLQSHPIRDAVDLAIEKSKSAIDHHPLQLNLPESLPPVRMDYVRIAEVIAQLLDNAAKYSARESPIHITGEVRNRKLMISVADRGPGIDDFEQSLIFDKFYRGRNQRLQVQGTGMGLAIARAIVEAHGGEVGVTSQLRNGSVFYFTLPLS